MKYLIALMFALTLSSCASGPDMCPQEDQSELCQCYRHEIPRHICYDRPNRFDRQ